MENGKLELAGMNIDISSIIGEKIVDQYLAQMSEEDMQTMINYITKDFFVRKDVFNYNTSKYDSKMVVAEREKDQWGSPKGKMTIGEFVREKFNERISEELIKKVEEIIATEDYQEKIEQIANEIIDYSVNGYKEDIKTRIRERLVGNILDASPSYGGISLTEIIQDEIHKVIRH